VEWGASPRSRPQRSADELLLIEAVSQVHETRPVHQRKQSVRVRVEDDRFTESVLGRQAEQQGRRHARESVRDGLSVEKAQEPGQGREVAAAVMVDRNNLHRSRFDALSAKSAGDQLVEFVQRRAISFMT
jgi:hypothetical protein